MSRFTLIILFVVLSGCAAVVVTVSHYDELYGPAQVQDRRATEMSAAASTYLTEIQPMLDKRCVVCHGCYDAPCQLKLTSPEGIDRGLTKALVHSGARILAVPPTRLYEDATTTQQWRDKGFTPVLNEREQTIPANLQASVLYRSLLLKRANPLPGSKILPDTFDFSLNREQQCVNIEEFDDYELQHAESGMPYGLPQLSQAEFALLEQWVGKGAKTSAKPELGKQYKTRIARWENWFNQDSNKGQLVSRYIYEHLFLSHLYFTDLPDVYFKLVRSKTPPGQPIEIIATRRPYEDPAVDRVYYRFMREQETILAKTHLPYSLNAARMATFDTLFYKPEYTVETLPGYQVEVAANPFVTFAAIPAGSRYKFLLQEAQNTIMNFIKGPVCRGQIALNVIDDHFWVFFATGQAQRGLNRDNFLTKQKQHLRLPAESESNAGVLVNWYKYSQAQKKYLQAKQQKLEQMLSSGALLDLGLVWNGENLTASSQEPSGNDNAALTVFRHFDSASVVKGLIGQEPKTAWLIDYPLLERIHYLLVAGFDIFGNVGHQLNTRLYMDFLRMESELNFLNLLPDDSRQKERDFWYRNEGISLQEYLEDDAYHFTRPTDIKYTSQDHKSELFGMLQQHLAKVLPSQYGLNQPGIPQQEASLMQQLMTLIGTPINQLPEVSVLLVRDGKDKRVYTLLKNVAHSNMSSLLNEASNLLPEEDTLTVVSGILGDYPSVYLNVNANQLTEFVRSLAEMKTEQDYAQWLDIYGVRRTDPGFWSHSDTIQQLNAQQQPIRAGLLDYNRLENR